MSGGRFVTGADLEARVALCKLQPSGRLALPHIQSSDLRIIGAKALDKQRNTKMENLQHASGWTSSLVTFADFGGWGSAPGQERGKTGGCPQQPALA